MIKFGERLAPVAECAVDLPPCEKSALEMVRELIALKGEPGRSAPGLAAPLAA